MRPLGFGRADLVVAVPKSWIDVETMSDLEEVGHDLLARSGRRMRVATKYLTQTRAFFARHGVADYRIARSGGATEGAPAAGSAELVVDITTTGATLEANSLKILADGVILRSQAHLTASLRADWDEARLAVAERLLRIVEARAAARKRHPDLAAGPARRRRHRRPGGAICGAPSVRAAGAGWALGRGLVSPWRRPVWGRLRRRGPTSCLSLVVHRRKIYVRE